MATKNCVTYVRNLRRTIFNTSHAKSSRFTYTGNRTPFFNQSVASTLYPALYPASSSRFSPSHPHEKVGLPSLGRGSYPDIWCPCQQRKKRFPLVSRGEKERERESGPAGRIALVAAPLSGEQLRSALACMCVLCNPRREKRSFSTNGVCSCRSPLPTDRRKRSLCVVGPSKANSLFWCVSERVSVCEARRARVNGRSVLLSSFYASQLE